MKHFIIADFKIIGVTADEHRAFYLADMVKSGWYYVNELSFESFETFSNAELAKIYTLATTIEAPEKWDRETLIGVVYNHINELPVDERTVGELREKLGREPEAPKIVPQTEAQRIAANGDTANAGKGASAPAAATGAVNKAYPKPGSTSHGIWTKADELREGESDIKALRLAVVAWGEVQGINASTVRTQFNHWRNYHSL